MWLVSPMKAGVITQALRGIRGEDDGEFLRKCWYHVTHPVWFYRLGVKVIVRCLYRIRYVDFHHIPETGPAIIICNHVTYMDGMVIDAGLKRPVRFLIDEDIYNVPGVHYFMSLYKAIPIAPNRESVQKALDKVSEALDNGELVCIFPEGSLTYTGNMTRFKFGVEWMLKRNPVPVIPMALRGLWGSIFSRKYLGQRYPFLPRSLFRKVRAICGPVIPPEMAHVNRLQREVMRLKNSAKF